MMKMTHAGLLGAGIILGLTGCVTSPMALAPVGPDPTVRTIPGPEGDLEVYTATHPIEVDYLVYFNPHAGYDIDDTSGKRVKFVANHSSDIDEQPDWITLLPGNYIVVAESTWCGVVKVPVVIQEGKHTVVHLDGNGWGPSHSSTPLVFLPNGEAVGWSGLIAQPLK